MSAEFIIKFRNYFGNNDAWAESIDGLGREANDREAAIRQIEDCGFEVAAVLAVECINGKYEARDVTASIMKEVMDREEKFLRDKFYGINPNITLDEFIWSQSKYARAM